VRAAKQTVTSRNRGNRLLSINTPSGGFDVPDVSWAWINRCTDEPSVADIRDFTL